MIGKTAIVIEEINAGIGTGLVKLDGDIWKAKTIETDIQKNNETSRSGNTE